jgi:enterochelin esterase-like enzyme
MRALGFALCCGLLAACQQRGASASQTTSRAAATASDTARPQKNTTNARATRRTQDQGTTPARRIRYHYPTTALGEIHVVIDVPRAREPLPVLIALHGWGEALKGSRRGAEGWIDDYGLPRALERLAAPPLVGKQDFGGFFSAPRLARINQDLARRPYQGLIVVCPYTPRGMLSGFEHVAAYARFLVDELLPRVRRDTRAIASAKATGIDGVSLGGRSALLVGFARPEAFGSVASLQAAFYPREIAELVMRGKRAFTKNPKLRLRLLTSSNDGYREVNHDIAKALQKAGVRLKLDDVPGPHTYGFNRGPGVYEMLLWHDRALRNKETL